VHQHVPHRRDRRLVVRRTGDLTWPESGTPSSRLPDSASENRFDSRLSASSVRRATPPSGAFRSASASARRKVALEYGHSPTTISVTSPEAIKTWRSSYAQSRFGTYKLDWAAASVRSVRPAISGECRHRGVRIRGGARLASPRQVRLAALTGAQRPPGAQPHR